MSLLAAGFGLFIALLGAWFLFSPDSARSMIGGMESKARFAFAFAIRLIMGLVFLAAASTSKSPQGATILGCVVLVAAVAVIIIGRTRVDALVEWWLAQSDALLRGWSVFALMVGVGLAYLFV